MNKLIHILFISIFLLEYLSLNLGLISRYLTWLPEILSILTVLFISGHFMLNGIKNVSPKCFFFISLFLFNILMGIIINLVPPGPLIAGFRSYLKFIPFFFLPFAYHFSNQQIIGQIKLLLFLFLIQAPVALYQRLVESKGDITGDYVEGTLTDSGFLTVNLTCAISVLMSFYLAKKISFSLFLVIFIIFFIPLTLNETKATLVFLPMALFLPLLFSKNIELKQLIPITVLMTCSAITFVFVYNYFVAGMEDQGILDIFKGDRITQYLYKGDNLVTDYSVIGKIDSQVIALKAISENIFSLIFGFGIGNVSESFIPWLSGEYAEKYSIFDVGLTSLTLILWELGLFGVVLYYTLFFMSFIDSRSLSSHNDSFISTFSNSWSAVSILMMIGIAYTNIIKLDATAYMFWYFSGYIIAENYKYKNNTELFI